MFPSINLLNQKKMSNKIEEKIRQLKEKFYDVSSKEAWVTGPNNRLDKETTKFKLKSQVEILKELLKETIDE